MHCDNCGAALADPKGPAPPEPPSRPPAHLAEKIRAGREALEGERKQVTVLFSDVMGSMELAEQSDPEEWRTIMGRFFSILCEGVHRFEGTVDKFTGDGIMALFGAPVAHEDHARRACYAALHLQRELASYAAELRRTKGLSFSVRTGLNSGEVVVGAIGDDLEMDYTAIGYTVGLAQRMEQLAAADRIYLTEHTAALVEDHVALTDLGEFQVKGTSRSLRVYELTGGGAAGSRRGAPRARGFSRFVGRDEELHALETALERALAGEAQVVGIVGEAGVGKSRLCQEFTRRQRERGVPVYHVAGQPHAKSVPLLPVLQLMRAYFDITDKDSDQTARERIAGKLLLLDESFGDDLPLLFELLAVPDPGRSSPRMDPEARQRQLFALMKRVIRAQGEHAPGVNLFEDLHWLDPASEAFLANHIEAIQGTRILTVVNFRPEYRAPWMSKSYYRQIALAPLGAEATEQLLADLLGSDESLGGLPELIRERTQGNPFFIEEVVQSLAEAGCLEGEPGAYRLVRAADTLAVPASVHAVLAARIDRLAPRGKSVLQAAAVIGKEFSAPVLARVTGLAPAELDDVLGELVGLEFVYEQELYPEAVYAFKHPLTQEVAYGSQLAERRASVHAEVARALAEQYPERLDERAALLAQHWEAAGEPVAAAHWHALAADWAGTNDPNGALRHWSRVRELADALPESDETTRLRLTARVSLLNYGWRLGISHTEAEALFADADRIATESGDIRSRAILLAIYATVRGHSEGDLRDYARLAREAVALADASGDPALYLTVSGSVTYALFCVGESREAAAVCDRAIELADGDPNVGAGVVVNCPYAFCVMGKGVAIGNLGDLQEGRRLVELGMKLAREAGDLELAGWGYWWSAWQSHFLGETEASVAHAGKAIEIAERIGDSYSRAWAWCWLGLAERGRGEWRRAIEALDRSVSLSRERRTAVEGQSLRLAVLGECYAGLGDLEHARALGSEAVEVARTQGHVIWEGYAHLALGRILLAAGDLDGAVPALSRALRLARRSRTRIFEPAIHVELAAVARAAGDVDRSERELLDARRLFTEVGAPRQAERLDVPPAPLPAAGNRG
jgi:class 3 adenylate cyclase/tetratricopeptide (TPR) repeat protein